MDREFKEKLLLEIHAGQAVITESIKAIQEDLKEHMRRTDQNEVYIRNLEKTQIRDIQYVKKHIYYVQGALGLLAIIGTIAGIMRYFTS